MLADFYKNVIPWLISTGDLIQEDFTVFKVLRRHRVGVLPLL